VNFEEKLVKFQAFIIVERKKYQYDLSLIGNADQTPFTFDMPANSMVDSKGTKSVSIMTTGHEKDRFTVMLACLGDGTKLPPMLCLSAKLCQSISCCHGVCIVMFKPKGGWMNPL